MQSGLNGSWDAKTGVGLEQQKQYRLLTRGDFDGVVCAALLKERGLVDEIVFVDPRQMQHREVSVTERDITANLPFVPGCHLAFDHHSSETIRAHDAAAARFVNNPVAPSAAQVIYEYYGGARAFPNIRAELITAVNRADSARFSHEEIMNPSGYVLINFLLDGRTGLGRFRDFRISTVELLRLMVDACREHTADELLLLPHISERVRVYFEQEEYFKQQIRRIADLQGKLVVLDLRNEERIYAGNRFMVYALYPEASVSMHCLREPEKSATLFAIGRSIVNRTCTVNVGELCLAYEGGGHNAAGTCQVADGDADRVKRELITRLRKGV